MIGIASSSAFDLAAQLLVFKPALDRASTGAGWAAALGAHLGLDQQIAQFGQSGGTIRFLCAALFGDDVDLILIGQPPPGQCPQSLPGVLLQAHQISD
jgi:hypothetical protein